MSPGDRLADRAMGGGGDRRRRFLGVLREHLDGVATVGDNSGDRRAHVSCSDDRDSGHGILLMVGVGLRSPSPSCLPAPWSRS
jgi:hypothetical protein